MIRLAPAALALVLALSRSPASARVVHVEPGESTRWVDLIGKEISVDGRVRLFQLHPGRGIDEVTLKLSPVVFRLPARLRFSRSPDAPAARLQGFLRQEGDQLVCEVSELELLPRDLLRLNRGIEALPPGEFERRGAWARWAEARGKAYNDRELLERGRVIEAEAIRIESERPTPDPVQLWLSLARRARTRKIPEPEPSALAHQAFRRQLAEARTLEELQALTNELAAFFPDASSRRPPRADLAPWERPYAEDPGRAYRAAPAPVRAALDRLLWIDAVQRQIECQAAADPKAARGLAGQAATQLPERPEVARRLLEEGTNAEAQDVRSMRLAEVQAIAAIYRDQLRDPKRARSLLRDWLDDQRDHHLSPTDAEGRVILANQYDALVDDRAAAIELLQAAWKIDPQSKEVADAFRRRNYHKARGEWVAIPRNRQGAGPASAEEPAPPRNPAALTLRGKTPTEVESQLGGKPNRVVYSASQGQIVEQWIYLGATKTQYVNFQHGGTRRVPTVVSYYSLSRPASSASAP